MFPKLGHQIVQLIEYCLYARHTLPMFYLPPFTYMLIKNCEVITFFFDAALRTILQVILKLEHFSGTWDTLIDTASKAVYVLPKHYIPKVSH